MDEIVRMISGDGSVKAMAITGRDLVERARQIHKLLPVATAALGRTLMAASLMGASLKEENGSVTLTIKGGGPLGSITAVSDSQGNPRGYLQDGQVELPLKGPAKLDVGTAVGADGTLTVIKDIGLKEPYIGSVQLVSGEIAEDLTAYFVESEQIPTACALGVLVDTDQSVLAAGGYLIQLLPGAAEGVIEKLENAIAKLGPVTNLLHQGADAVTILERVLDGMEPQLLERGKVEYECYCSRERVSRALISMGKEELDSLIEEQGGAELTCQFCDKVYEFDKPELESLLSEATGR
ncbi:MAG: Hsp33 family molecular chaperone HslO [Clostridia bacterium]|nr:Hsp33 family molecular chaperone HslO [Clostridia bacterium]